MAGVSRVSAVVAPVLLATAIAGLAVGVMMARRGRAEAWSLAGVFGLLILGSVVALWHLPTRLVLDARGVDVAFWGLGSQRDWSDVQAVQFRGGRFGTWVRIGLEPHARTSWFSVWSPRAGYYAGDPVEARQLTMRIEAWKLGRRP